jgi:hypothetical protein
MERESERERERELSGAATAPPLMERSFASVSPVALPHNRESGTNIASPSVSPSVSQSRRTCGGVARKLFRGPTAHAFGPEQLSGRGYLPLSPSPPPSHPAMRPQPCGHRHGRTPGYCAPLQSPILRLDTQSLPRQPCVAVPTPPRHPFQPLSAYGLSCAFILIEPQCNPLHYAPPTIRRMGGEKASLKKNNKSPQILPQQAPDQTRI